MYMCMYVCMYVCKHKDVTCVLRNRDDLAANVNKKVHIEEEKSTHDGGMFMYVCMYIYIYIYICMYVCM